MFNSMKLQEKVNASSARVYSQSLRKAQQQFSSAEGAGSNSHPEDFYNALFNVRAMQAIRDSHREESRAFHLARAFMKGQDYLQVENSVRPGNEPDIEYIASILETYGYSGFRSYVEAWTTIKAA